MASLILNSAQKTSSRISLEYFLSIIVIVTISGCYQSPAPVVIGANDHQEAKVGKESERSPARSSGNATKNILPIFKPKKTNSDMKVKKSGHQIRVTSGDTVYGLSRKYNTSLKQIISINNLKPPYKLLIGQSLEIPLEHFHTVVETDTIYSVSKLYNIDIKKLVRLNRIKSPYYLVVGDRLTLPAGSTKTKEDPRVTLVKPAEGVDLNGRGTLPSIASGNKSQFLWPINGKIISRFGPKDGGLHNDGINLEVSRGAPLRAAANGVVAYAGNELPGYGNLLLIRHADGWMSAYAHNKELLVARGDRVVQGEIIAYAGSSGNVSVPQSHFELRRNGKPVDPLKYLGKS